MSEVDICNLALGHIGDTANIASLTERSVQAQKCAIFYPVARRALLEMNTWGFATKRVKLALLATNPTLAIAQSVDPTASRGTWQYAYAQPAGVINAIAVLPAEALDDYEQQLWPVPDEYCPPYPQGYVPVPGPGTFTPQPFALETLDDGTQIVLTNCQDAVLRYTVDVTDTTKFGPLFTLALSHLLASMLAGPILKGEVGAAEAKAQLVLFQQHEKSAESSDANQRKTRVEPSPSWIRGR